MRLCTTVGLIVILAAGLAGCATATNPAPGERVLDAIVIAREYEPATGRISSWSVGDRDRSEITGSWYLVFEARDGEATAHYRLPVTQHQYMLFQEGADVQITLVGYDLRALRRRP